MDFIANHLLTLILFTPALAAVILFVLPLEEKKLIRWVAFTFSFLPLILSLILWFEFEQTRAGFQFEEKCSLVQCN